MREKTVGLIIPVYRPDRRFAALLKRISRQSVTPEKILILHTVPDEAYASFPEEKITAGKNSSPENARDEKNSVSASEKMLWEELGMDRPEGVLPLSVIRIPKSRFDHGGTRALGAAQMTADLLMFMTMDALPADRDLVCRLREAFEDPRVACAYARQLPGRNSSVLEAYTREYNYGPESLTKTKDDLERMGIKTFFCSNVCAMYRRDIYEELGGFVRRTIFNEDMIFAGKAIDSGYAVRYCADARVMHSHRYTGLQQLRRNFDLGVSQAEHPEVFERAVSEKEGIRMVKQQAVRMIRGGRPDLLPVLVWQSGCKYAGYFLGKRSSRLPVWLKQAVSTDPGYFSRRCGTEDQAPGGPQA